MANPYVPTITFHGERFGGESKVLYDNGVSDLGLSGSLNDRMKKEQYANWNGDWLGYLTYMADSGDAASRDRLFNYLTEKDAREWTADREDTQYQRLVQDLARAGINPYILMQSGATPIASSASGQSGNSFSSYELGKEKNDQNWLKVLVSMIPIAIAAIATIVAL